MRPGEVELLKITEDPQEVLNYIRKIEKNMPAWLNKKAQDNDSSNKEKINSISPNTQ